MTLELSFAFTSFILVLSLFWLLKVCRRSKPHNIVQKSPPGPRKLPLIGNLHNLIGSLPHHALRKLAGKYGPLMHLQLGEISAIGVSSPRVTREVLKTNDLALRRDHNCLAALANKCKDLDALALLLKESTYLGGGFDLADLFPLKKFLHVFTGLKSKLENVHRQVDQILGNVINDHRENQKSATTGNGELSREDFVDVLIGLQQSGSLGFPITNNHIKAVILVCRRSKPHNIVQKSPPGPRKLPLIGNLHNLIGSLPHHALRKLAGKYGPLMHLQLGEISAIGVSSPRVTREVLKTNDLALRRDHNCLAALANKCKDLDALALLLKESTYLGGGFDLADLFPLKKFLHVFTGLKSKLENVHRQVDQILGNVINDHRENQKSATTGNGELSREDFVDVLIGLQQSVVRRVNNLYLVATPYTPSLDHQI
nr:premnaspirodiene oxygenase [Quercus suber]